MKSESKIQQEIFEYYWNNYCLPHHEPREMFFHIPNEKQQRLVKIGVLPGAADLFLTIKGVSHFVEVKDEDGSQSENQEKFERHCEQTGLDYSLCRSLDEFKEWLQEKLGDTPIA